ncbi:MAG: DUF2142 domain-containing protein [Chloroflexi bacterium]|nr:DUF2142 domain-containing protein [Chloroflexota bacterium]
MALTPALSPSPEAAPAASGQRRPARLSLTLARALLAAVLLGYGYLAVGYARATPRWNNPDEPAHFSYLRYVALTRQLPVLQAGDWDADLLERLKTDWFPNDYEIESIRYESHQPPLYYLFGAAVHRLTWDLPIARQVLALRALSIALGAVVVICAYVVGREVAPGRPDVAVLAAATVAFTPMNTAISAAVNNDSLANALAALTLAVLLVGWRRGFGDRAAFQLGVLVGALVLTKLTVYVYVPLILGTLLLANLRSTAHRRATAPVAARRPSSAPHDCRSGSPHGWWSEASPGDWLRALRRPVLAGLVGLVVSSWWLIRNVLTYGPLDPLAMARHDAVVVGQPRWESLDLESLGFFFKILFRSFWGVFGWMGVVLDDGFYFLYLALTLLAVVGLFVGWRTARGASASAVTEWAGGRTGPHVGVSSAYDLDRHGDAGARVAAGTPPADAIHGRWLLVTPILLVAGEVAYYNVSFIQPQGRYLFPALVPLAVLLAIGWTRLASFATARLPVRLLTTGLLAGAIGWSLGEAHGALRAVDLWPDERLIAVALVAGLAATYAPLVVRRRLTVGLPLVLALTLGLLDLAALVRFVAPAFPHR